MVSTADADPEPPRTPESPTIPEFIYLRWYGVIPENLVRSADRSFGIPLCTAGNLTWELFETTGQRGAWVKSFVPCGALDSLACLPGAGVACCKATGLISSSLIILLPTYGLSIASIILPMSAPRILSNSNNNSPMRLKRRTYVDCSSVFLILQKDQRILSYY
jgi:hypothetical protein